MIQFRRQVDFRSKRFTFEGIRPNAGPNNTPGVDLLGSGVCRKRPRIFLGMTTHSEHLGYPLEACAPPHGPIQLALGVRLASHYPIQVEELEGPVDSG